jgi:hypothetical protein
LPTLQKGNWQSKQRLVDGIELKLK